MTFTVPNWLSEQNYVFCPHKKNLIVLVHCRSRSGFIALFAHRGLLVDGATTHPLFFPSSFQVPSIWPGGKHRSTLARALSSTSNLQTKRSHFNFPHALVTAGQAFVPRPQLHVSYSVLIRKAILPPSHIQIVFAHLLKCVIPVVRRVRVCIHSRAASDGSLRYCPLPVT